MIRTILLSIMVFVVTQLLVPSTTIAQCQSGQCRQPVVNVLKVAAVPVRATLKVAAVPVVVASNVVQHTASLARNTVAYTTCRVQSRRIAPFRNTIRRLRCH